MHGFGESTQGFIVGDGFPIQRTGGPLKGQSGRRQLVLQGRLFSLHQIHQKHLAPRPQAAGQGREKSQFAAVIGEALQHEYRKGAVETRAAVQIFQPGVLPGDAFASVALLAGQPFSGGCQHRRRWIDGGQSPVGALTSGFQQLGACAAAGHQDGGAWH